MKFYVNIDSPSFGSHELAEILRDIADSVENSRSVDELCRGKLALVGAFPVRDTTGTTVGVYGFNTKG